MVLGQSVTLECEADGQPQPEVTWYKERRPVVSGAHLRTLANGSLVIASTQRSDAGLYTCTAKNQAGRASHDMRLVIQGQLNANYFALGTKEMQEFCAKSCFNSVSQSKDLKHSTLVFQSRP